jgi:hypothetical protein
MATLDHYTGVGKSEVVSREKAKGHLLIANSRYGPDRAPRLADSATGVAVVATAVLPQHDATPKIPRRHAQLGRERCVVV